MEGNWLHREQANISHSKSEKPKSRNTVNVAKRRRDTKGRGKQAVSLTPDRVQMLDGVGKPTRWIYGFPSLSCKRCWEQNWIVGVEIWIHYYT